MLDLKQLRENPLEIEKKLKTKDSEVKLKPILELDEKARQLKTQVENLKGSRNALSKEIGDRKRKGEDTNEIFKQVGDFGDKIKDIDKELSELTAALNHKLSLLPNIPASEAKESLDPSDNVCIKEHGKKTHFSFPYKNHLELNEQHDLFDLERGAKISGTGWPIYKGMGARLEWALLNLMVDFHVKKGFQQWMPPLLVREEMMYGSGQYPKFKDQAYELEDKQSHLCLLPTAEVALNALHYDEILTEEELPLKYMAYTPCFRREAGAAGKNERGLIRTHQFNKVEMFSFCHPDRSEAMFNTFIESAEALLEMLELPYKRMLLVTGDMSFPAAKTVDIEVNLPGQDRYMEVSSISNCTDFQARRSKIRFRSKGEKPRFVHTLNGSGLATSRVMVALLENHQNADGSISIPKALQKYLGGMEKFLPKR
ncbi:MAG: Serine--tRNA ligase [Chlamydiae bacterium]|nr:Serine--tRNA ligase [Chlamydiota bacterium]